MGDFVLVLDFRTASPFQLLLSLLSSKISRKLGLFLGLKVAFTQKENAVIKYLKKYILAIECHRTNNIQLLLNSL